MRTRKPFYLFVISCLASLIAGSVLADDLAQEPHLLLAQNSGRVVKQVACPREIKVSSIENTGDWEIPAVPAKFSRVKVATRTMGNQNVYSAVCYFKVYGGEVPVERVLGDVREFGRCEIGTVSGREGVKCYAR